MSVYAPIVEELVAANRILAAQGVVDAFGHVSVRHPERPNRFFVALRISGAGRSERYSGIRPSERAG